MSVDLPGPTEGIATANTDAFVIKRLRAKPVTYSVVLTHYVSGGEWMLGVELKDIGDMDAQQRESIAHDLRYAADLVEKAAWERTT